MIIGIDASNIRSGGGVTHLVEILSSVKPNECGIERIVVWASLATLKKIPAVFWVVKKHKSVFEKSYLSRALWQRRCLSNEVKLEKCDLLFVPGGSFVSKFRPIVTMNRNLLPFEWTEIFRYGPSLFAVKLIFLRFVQKYALKNADGIIFLTDYARESVLNVCGKVSGKVINIPHGVNQDFLSISSDRVIKENFSDKNPCKIVYVSTIDFYKHQDNVIKAVDLLVAQGFPLSLNLIGGSYTPALKKINRKIGDREYIRYLGPVKHDNLKSFYKDADIGIFASSCETFGQILVEKMASGLPIACSKRSCMPEILGNSGIYFDPEDPESIAKSIKKMFLSKDLRKEKAELAYNTAMEFSWEKCAFDTFDFLKKVAHKKQ